MLNLGINPWFGTPVNPLDPALSPGGSSSGSAVAVATGEADVALGSDTGGSVGIPAACCGVFGLKTTHGRISLEGVWPLAPSLDTIGPIATSIAGLALGMELLEPGFAIATSAAGRIGRVRTGGLPEIEAAVDRALRAALKAIGRESPVSEQEKQKRSFGHVDTWVFDLDNTLYPREINLWQQVDTKIRDYVAQFLKISNDDAHRLQKEFYQRYGTTMRGMMTEHGISADDYLRYVHDIDHCTSQRARRSIVRLRPEGPP